MRDSASLSFFEPIKGHGIQLACSALSRHAGLSQPVLVFCQSMNDSANLSFSEPVTACRTQPVHLHCQSTQDSANLSFSEPVKACKTQPVLLHCQSTQDSANMFFSEPVKAYRTELACSSVPSLSIWRTQLAGPSAEHNQHDHLLW